MSRAGTYALSAVVIVAALAAGLYFGYAMRMGDPAPNGPSALRHTKFTDLQGRPMSLEQWNGKRLLVNFWATWCAPCREEMPMLNALSAEYAANGVEFVGIAVDNPEPVQKFAQQLGIRYPLLIGGAEAFEVVRVLGNKSGGLPYTVLLEPDGRISQSRLGQLHEAEVRTWLGAPAAGKSR